MTRPPHPAPDVRDDRDTPPLVRRDGERIYIISEKRKEKYFASRPEEGDRLDSAGEINFWAQVDSAAIEDWPVGWERLIAQF
jgi:hypothetical protein